MFSLKRGEMFLCTRTFYDNIYDFLPFWRIFKESRGDIFMGEYKVVNDRRIELNGFYRHIPIKIYKLTEKEIEELVILKLKG